MSGLAIGVGVGAAALVSVGIGAYVVHRRNESHERDEREAATIAKQRTLAELPGVERPTAEVAVLLLDDFDKRTITWSRGDGFIRNERADQVRRELPVGEGERYNEREENFMGFHDKVPAIRYESAIQYDGERLWSAVREHANEGAVEPMNAVFTHHTEAWLRDNYDSDGNPATMTAGEQQDLFADFPEAFTEPTRVTGDFKMRGELTRW